MKPEIVQCYKTRDGQRLDTLDEWKRAELIEEIKAAPTPTDTETHIAEKILANADVVADILNHSERGRPKGAKNKSKKSSTPTVVPTPTA